MKLLAWTARRALDRLGHRPLLIIMTLAFSFNAVAAPTKSGHPVPQAPQIPKKPSTPPSLTQPIPSDPFQCHRTFVYQGKTLDCDNPIQRDGEKLRPIIKDVPEALSELDAYQKTQRHITNVAYVVSGSVLLALGGFIAARTTGGNLFKDANGNISAQNLVAIGGLATAIGAFSYGFVLYQKNETRLTAAVNAFNNARPNTPIELEFNTGITF
jgi:hypothetical protein